MTLEKFLTLSKSILCLSVAASVLVVLPFIVNQQITVLNTTVAQTKTETIALVDRRFDTLQGGIDSWLKIADNRIASLEKNTYGLAGDLRKDTFSAIANTRKDMFGAIVETRVDALTKIDSIASNLDKQLTKTNESVSTLVTAYADIPTAVGARFDNQTDCTRNALCWQNLTTDTLTNFRFTGRDISSSTKTFNEGFPVLMSGVNTTVINFASITSNINRLTTPKWYDRLLGYGLNGVMIYRNLNPATNIVVKGTQFLTSH
jgi:ABC-type transporter Mla MlaB component